MEPWSPTSLSGASAALNIDGSRVPGEPVTINKLETVGAWSKATTRIRVTTTTEGRWPANLVHDGSEAVLATSHKVMRDVSKRANARAGRPAQQLGAGESRVETAMDSNSAARFFYCAKPSRREKDPAE